ncbi:MAG: shikimate dehydrogenase [Spirochaetes bacterium]|nr:shikimate dehydrogenase [Spirochaetota bacterium]
MIESPNRPTFYFIGVTTVQSSIMKVFPRWMEAIGRPEIGIEGCDIEPGGPREKYREILRHIREQRYATGALVTTHKIDILEAARDLFDRLDDLARLCGEVSCISKRRGLVYGYATDPISVGLALEDFLPPGYWEKNRRACVFIMGAGGSGLALSVYLVRTGHGANIPQKIFISNRRPERLDRVRRVHERMGMSANIEYVQVNDATSNDDILKTLPPGSLVVNATGMGKDRPGSPLSNDAVFPLHGYVWEFNYRGDLKFLRQAERQKRFADLVITDGWMYFVHGWMQGVGKALQVDLSAGDTERLSRIAAEAGR